MAKAVNACVNAEWSQTVQCSIGAPSGTLATPPPATEDGQTCRTMRLKSAPAWSLFVLYILVAVYTMAHHEPWGDEIHSWNIAKSSRTFSELLNNTRYEGHPPAWYAILWGVSLYTHNPAALQFVHLTIVAAAVFAILFLSPFPFAHRALLPFGYFFVFEYATLSRNYAIGVLIALTICAVSTGRSGWRVPAYYGLLFVMANSHLLALILAFSLHVYFLSASPADSQVSRRSALHATLGLLIFLCALYFIIPPADSQLGIRYWAERWESSQLRTLVQAPLRAFLPVPAWWVRSFWDTQFLLETQGGHRWLQMVNPGISLGVIVVTVWVLADDARSRRLFLLNLLPGLLVSGFILPFTHARYAGFIFIGFITAYWLRCRARPLPLHDRTRHGVTALLLIQVAGGGIAVMKEIRLPFSNASKVVELLEELPAGETLVTDYWTLDAAAAFADRPFYCVDIGREMSFVSWGQELAAVLKKPGRYSSGFRKLFEQEGTRSIYLLSALSVQNLLALDPALPGWFGIVLVDNREGAVEKGSNLYLYRITPLQ